MKVCLYFKSDLSNIKICQKNNLFHPEMILRSLNIGLLNISLFETKEINF